MSDITPPAHQPLAEHLLLPYHPLRTLGIGSLLVLAPHPDDEVLGCGGLLALAVAQGVQVRVVVLTDGAAGGDAALREAEGRAAAREIGYLRHDDSLQFWRLPDRGLVPDEGLAQRLAQTITASRPDWVLAPSPFEIHPDHRAACQAAIMACSRPGVPAGTRLGFYEVGQALIANCLVDITTVQGIKQRAMHCFGSQLSAQDYDDHITALNRYRSYTLGPGVSHAEALHFVELAPAALTLEAVLAAQLRHLQQRFWPQPAGGAG
ncbi:MAG: PIG-L family deacetylase [Burkholderiales bacterium]|nr:PIG-L family deacetylase [Burkholderiales bacterium]